MVANTGTYLDAPLAPAPRRRDLAGLPLEPGRRARGVRRRRARASQPAVDSGAFDGVDVDGRAVLVRTGWDRALAHGGVRRPGRAVPHRRRGRLRSSTAAPAGRHRLAQHRQRSRRHAAGAHAAAGARRPRAGAPDEPRGAAGGGVRAARRTRAGARDGDLPGPGVRRAARPRLAASARSRRGQPSTPRRSSSSSRTRAASAWPRVAFMTAPTIAPAAATLPPRIFSATSALAARRDVDGREQRAVVADDLQPAGRDDLVRASPRRRARPRRPGGPACR